jgi:hypothetical protein
MSKEQRGGFSYALTETYVAGYQGFKAWITVVAMPGSGEHVVLGGASVEEIQEAFELIFPGKQLDREQCQKVILIRDPGRDA